MIVYFLSDCKWKRLFKEIGHNLQNGKEIHFYVRSEQINRYNHTNLLLYTHIAAGGGSVTERKIKGEDRTKIEYLLGGKDKKEV